MKRLLRATQVLTIHELFALVLPRVCRVTERVFVLTALFSLANRIRFSFPCNQNHADRANYDIDWPPFPAVGGKALLPARRPLQL